MLDPLTIDQLRVLDLVEREGSLSAAARKLARVQSAVSQSLSNLESTLGLPLVVRGRRESQLTPAGARVLAQARIALREVDAVRALARELSGGVEPEVILSIDSLYPLGALSELCCSFVKRFPHVDLRVETETLSAVSARVVSGQASLGIALAPGIDPSLRRLAIGTIRMVPVVSPRHPLAKVRGRATSAALSGHVQIVLTERSGPGVPDQAVTSLRTWRVADLTTKHVLLRGGLGWGNMPEEMVAGDLRAKRLVRLRLDTMPDGAAVVPLFLVHREDRALGPAHRWILDRLTRAPLSR